MKLQIDNITFSDWREILIQTDVISTSGAHEITYTTFAEWWSTCTNDSQLLKLAAQDDSITRQQLVFTACQVARSVLHFVSKGEDRPRIAIETAEAWCLGKATDDEVKAAGNEAWCLGKVTFAEVKAASNAARAARAAANAANIVNADGYAVYYAVRATANTAYITHTADAPNMKFHGRDATQAKLADLVRQHLPIPTQLDHDMQQLLKLKAFW